MALKDCRECGKQIAGDAKKCPYCGTPNPAMSQTSYGIMWLIIIVVSIYFTYYFYKSCSGVATSISSVGEKCWICNGKGINDCPMCVNGRTEDSRTCTFCNGKGTITCTFCNGTGKAK